jgi:thiamine biosynthesis lipoprotein
MRQALVASALIVTALLACTSCTRGKERIYRKSITVMDTVVTITVVSDSKEKAGRAIDRALREMEGLEGLLSFWSAESEIAAVNRMAGAGAVKVSPMTMDVVRKSLYISGRTSGAFDPTIGPVIRLWDFRERKKPGEEALRKALELVDYKKVIAEGDEVYLGGKGMSFDTGGIAKGFAADVAERVLRRMGIRAGLIAVAGDIKAFGSKPDGGAWQVGIRHPRADGEEEDLLATLDLMDEAISTSGDYERFFIQDGTRYHHLLDPKTGYPAEGFVSVSVIAKEAVLSDGFSTGVFVMGAEEGLELMKEEGLEGVLVYPNGGIYVTDGLKDRVRLSAAPEPVTP